MSTQWNVTTSAPFLGMWISHRWEKYLFFFFPSSRLVFNVQQLLILVKKLWMTDSNIWFACRKWLGRERFCSPWVTCGCVACETDKYFTEFAPHTWSVSGISSKTPTFAFFVLEVKPVVSELLFQPKICSYGYHFAGKITWCSGVGVGQ